jgi:hypothetical protein
VVMGVCARLCVCVCVCVCVCARARVCAWLGVFVMAFRNGNGVAS